MMPLPMVERFILLCFGGIMISSLFVLYQFGRLVLVELHDRASGSLIADHRSLSFSLWLCLGSVGMFGNAAVRVHDGFINEHFGGHTPAIIAIFLLMIWISGSGFHWLASRKRAAPWNLYIGCILVWIAVVAWPLLG